MIGETKWLKVTAMKVNFLFCTHKYSTINEHGFSNMKNKHHFFIFHHALIYLGNYLYMQDFIILFNYVKYIYNSSFG